MLLRIYSKGSGKSSGKKDFSCIALGTGVIYEDLSLKATRTVPGCVYVYTSFYKVNICAHVCVINVLYVCTHGGVFVLVSTLDSLINKM